MHTIFVRKITGALLLLGLAVMIGMGIWGYSRPQGHADAIEPMSFWQDLTGTVAMAVWLYALTRNGLWLLTLGTRSLVSSIAGIIAVTAILVSLFGEILLIPFWPFTWPVNALWYLFNFVPLVQFASLFMIGAPQTAAMPAAPLAEP